MKDDFKVQFTFIDGRSKGHERKKSRSHVTAQHYRRKRYDAIESRRDKIHQFGAPASANIRQDEIPSDSSYNHGLSIKKPLRKSQPDERGEEPQLLPFPNLHSLSAARSDPFSTYPVATTPEVNELVDHYCYVIPSLMHKHWGRAIRKPRSAWDLFGLYRQQRSSFIGMLHHSAHHLANLKGLVWTIKALRLKQEAIVAVNTKLEESSGPYDDGTIVAVGLLANGERLWGSREVAEVHWAALKRMISQRGGFPAMKENKILHTKLLWSYIALSWPTSGCEVLRIDRSCGDGTEMNANVSGRAELGDFMRRRTEQCLQRISAGDRSPRPHFLSPTLWEALTPKETGYQHPDKRQAVENCRMACLIFLNLVLADHGEGSESAKMYFQELGRLVEDEADDSALTAEHLLWTLLSANILPDDFETCWTTSRLMSVVKKAGIVAWAEIEESLRLFLGYGNSIAAARGLIHD